MCGCGRRANTSSTSARTSSCALRGAKDVYEAAHDAPGVPHGGEVSDDGLFTVHEEECLGVVRLRAGRPDRLRELRPRRRPSAMRELVAALRRRRGARALPRPGDAELPARLARRSPASSRERRRREPGLRAPSSPATGTSPRPWARRLRPRGGYEGLKQALAHEPARLDPAGEGLRPSRPRRRGVPDGHEVVVRAADTGKPTYVVVNFDESEPGTCNNRELVEREPHRLIEGTAIARHAIGCHTAFIYIRGEYLWQAIVLQRALDEAYAGGYLGSGIAGSGLRPRHRAAPGRRRLHLRRRDRAARARWRACAASRACARRSRRSRGCTPRRPSINNVETLMNVPHIVARRRGLVRAIGTEKSPGTKMFTVSGKVERPGNYEVPMGTPLRVLLEELAGGVLDGRRAEGLDARAGRRRRCSPPTHRRPLDFESVAGGGLAAGHRRDHRAGRDRLRRRGRARAWSQFYAHESCGKCTPCREGTLVGDPGPGRLENGYGRERTSR